MPTPPYRGWLSPIGARNSASPETPIAYKSHRLQSRFYAHPDTSQYNVTTVEIRITDLSLTCGAVSQPPQATASEATIEAARPAAQRPLGASSPERGAGANRAAHRPRSAGSGPLRADPEGRAHSPTGGRGTRRRCGAVLHSTLVRTTQEPLSYAKPGSSAAERGEVRAASASWSRAAASHPTEPARWSA